MKNISISAGLSIQYTNQSIRATTITLLDAGGYDAHHITSLTRHKSFESLKTYSRTSIGAKRRMSDVLASSFQGKTDFPVSQNFNFGFMEENAFATSK